MRNTFLLWVEFHLQTFPVLLLQEVPPYLPYHQQVEYSYLPSYHQQVEYSFHHRAYLP
jgi:hypothetical protein